MTLDYEIGTLQINKVGINNAAVKGPNEKSKKNQFCWIKYCVDFIYNNMDGIWIVLV